jgi:hypothetical protein
LSKDVAWMIEAVGLRGSLEVYFNSKDLVVVTASVALRLQQLRDFSKGSFTNHLVLFGPLD